MSHPPTAEDRESEPVLTPGLKAEIDRRLIAKGAARRCEVCHQVKPRDAFPPNSVICDRCYRLAGVDAWEDNDD